MSQVMSPPVSEIVDAEIIETSEIADIDITGPEDENISLSIFAAMVSEFGDPFSVQSAEEWEELKTYAHTEPWWPRDATSVMRLIAAQAGTTMTQWTAAHVREIHALEERDTMPGPLIPFKADTADPRVLELMDTWKARMEKEF